jgi:glycosyltransferase involved in cell wall biosynthesis
MRIGIDCRKLETPTGVGRYLGNLIPAFLEVDAENDYVLFHGGGLEDKLSGTGRAVAKRLRFPKHLWLNARLPFSLRSERIDVLHSPSYTLPLWPRTRTVVTIHDIIYRLHPHWFSPRRRLYYSRLVGASAHRADRIITVSHTSKQDIVRGYHIPPENIGVTYLAADPNYRPEEDPKVLGRIRDRFTGGTEFILHVGALQRRRNIDMLLDVLAELKREGGLSFSLLLVGKNLWPRSSPRAAAAKLGIGDSVIYRPFVPEEDMAALYSAARFLVYPSNYEGFGLPVIEAMACGTPVIASNVSAIPEVTGDAAILLDPTDPEPWKRAIRELNEDADLRTKLSAAGLERSRLFSWERTARDTLAIYRETLHA